MAKRKTLTTMRQEWRDAAIAMLQAFSVAEEAMARMHDAYRKEYGPTTVTPLLKHEGDVLDAAIKGYGERVDDLLGKIEAD